MAVSESPRYRIEPLVGWITPSSRRASVVLPLPLSPAMAVMDGLSSLTISDTPSTATLPPLRAARLGDGWYAGVNFRLSRLSRQTQAYRTALAGRDGTVAINRVTMVAETAAELDYVVQRHLANTLRAYAQPGESLQRVTNEVALVGTPGQITAQLERYQAAGVTHVFARLSLDDTPPEVALGTIGLLGREVIPRLAEYERHC